MSLKEAWKQASASERQALLDDVVTDWLQDCPKQFYLQIAALQPKTFSNHARILDVDLKPRAKTVDLIKMLRGLHKLLSDSNRNNGQKAAQEAAGVASSSPGSTADSEEQMTDRQKKEKHEAELARLKVEKANRELKLMDEQYIDRTEFAGYMGMFIATLKNCRQSLRANCGPKAEDTFLEFLGQISENIDNALNGEEVS
ncbi:MAG: hypothetical protein AAF394_03825 [Planctomycetota bacterium]